MRPILVSSLTIALAAASAATASAQQLAFRHDAPQMCAAAPAPTVQHAMTGSKSPTAAGSYPVIVTVPKPGYGASCDPSASAATAGATVRPAAPSPAPVDQPPVLPIPSVG